MTSKREVDVEVHGRIAVLTLAAPQRRNALTAAMARELIDACSTIDADTDIGAVVVRGAGGFFCAGAHRDLLGAAAADPFDPEVHRDMSSVYDSFVRVGSLEPPSIAAVRGGAVGAGVNLAFATDLRVMANDALLDAGFARLGIHPGGGHFVLLSRTAGREFAAGLGLFGATLTGARAAETGIAWSATDDDKVEAGAMAIAEPIAADPELAREVARSFRSEIGPPPASWTMALRAEREPQQWSLRRAARRESTQQ